MSNKNVERAELHKVIWKAATDFVHGGKVAAWDFKEYFLGMMFYRFISENIENYVNTNQELAGINGFEYKYITDEEANYGRSQILEEKGLFIKPSELFCNVRKQAEKDDNLNETLFNIFKNIESSAKGTNSENSVKGLFSSIDVNSNKLGETVIERNENLKKLLDVIGELPLGDYKSNTIDVFGDAYEYLMNMYAGTAGKKGGEFFTPQEVGELLAKIVIDDKKSVNKVYDPCCGSGGLLLKFAKILGKENVKTGFYGQEISLTNFNLARINMFLHDINYNKFNLVREDTLLKPAHWNDVPFDAIVSNPPYSTKWVGKDNALLISDERFSPAGVLAPKQKADLAFTMHMLSWLSPKGTAAIVEFPGILDRSNEKGEPGIRKYLVENNFIDAVIHMPENLFFGTQIDVCILVLKKNKTDNNILFVDARNEFIKVGNKNILSTENIENIISILKKRENIKYKSKLVSNEDIEDSTYNLSVNKYLEEKIEKSQIDINEVEKTLEKCINEITKKRIEINNIVEKLKNRKVKFEFKTLEECCDTITDYVAAGSFADLANNVKYLTQPSYAQLIRTTDLKSKFKGDNFIYIDKHAFDYLWRVNLDKECIVLPNIGNCGEVYYVTPEILPYENNALATNAILLRSSFINNKYLNYVFESEYFQRQLKKITSQQGQTKFNKTNLKKLIVPVPSLNDQKEIVENLDKFEIMTKLIEEELSNHNNQFHYYEQKLFEVGEENESSI